MKSYFKKSICLIMLFLMCDFLVTYASIDLATFNNRIATFRTEKYDHGSTYQDNPSLTGGYTCFGFANEVALYIWGSYPTKSMSAASVNSGWTVTYGGSAVDNLYVGDIVRYHYHSIFITGIDGDTIYYCQANTPSGTNKVTFNNTVSRSNLKSKVSDQLTSPGTTKTGWVAHYTDGISSTPPDTEAPTISNLRVENVSGDSFTIKCNLNDNVGVTRLWYVLYAPGGEYQFSDSASNGSYSKTLYTKDYGGAGTYSLHLYAYDAAGNSVKDKKSDINAYTDTESPLNIGDDFYATIIHTESWKPITRDDDGFIRLRSEKGSANQVWRFRRQDDGSYTIASTVDNKLLEMYCGVTDNNNPASVCNEDWGGAYQRWYIFKQGNGYVLQSKHYTSLNRVLTLQGFDTSDGMAVQTCVRTNLSTQIFSIYQGVDIQMKSPTLSYTTDGVMTTFSWNDIYGESGYDLLIYKDGNLYNSVRIASGNPCTYTQYLPIGNYTAHVQAFNAYEYKQSDTISISIAPIDIGTDVYAFIINTKIWKNITNNGEGTVESNLETGNPNQIWCFKRQNDGSYKIISALDGKLLDVQDASSFSGVQVGVCEDNGSTAQKWYIYEKDGSYILQAKCGECVLDLDSTSLYMKELSGNENQKFTIWKLNLTPQLSVNVSDGVVTFDWTTRATGVNYSIKTWKEKYWNGDMFDSEYVNDLESCSTVFPNGYFESYVDAEIGVFVFMSNVVGFNINKEESSSKSVVNKRNDIYTIKSILYNIEESCKIIVAAYKDGKFVTLTNVPYESEGTNTTLSGDIDEIKVMVWNSLSGLKPLCEAEIIPSSEFIIE